MNSLISKAKAIKPDGQNKFEKFNLIENPFPINPFVSQDSPDKRYNGEIYEETIRTNEFSFIENNFLKIPQTDLNHNRIGYVIDDSYVGRGNGKSTFALNLLKKINHNYCMDITSNVNKCFGLYVVPAPSGRTRTFSNLLDLIIDAMYNNEILKYALAALRLEIILEHELIKLNEEELSDEKKLIENLNSKDWFNKNKLNHNIISNYISQKNEYNFLSSENPLRKRYTNFDGVNINIVTSQTILDYYKSLKKDVDKIDFIFNDLVCIFLMAGFNGAYIIVDDFERIPDFQSDRQKRDFAFELRTNFFDGSSKNARIGFYNLILMLHAGVPRLIGNAWGESGMDQRSPISMSASSKHIIPFKKLNQGSATLLIKKYLSEYRIKPDNDNLIPFTLEAVSKMGKHCEYNAAKILKLANTLLENAVEKNISEINKEFVEVQLKIESIEIEQSRSIIEEKSEDLLSKIEKDE